MMRFTILFATLAALLAAPVHASMIGTSVTASYQFNAGMAGDTVTATGGTDISCPGAFDICSLLTLPGQTLSFGASSITYALTGDALGSFSGGDPARFVFSGLMPGFAIGSVTLATTIVGLDLTRVAVLSASSVAVTMGGLAVQDGSTFTLTLLPAPTGVPAPGAALLLLAGLAGLAASRRG